MFKMYILRNIIVVLNALVGGDKLTFKGGDCSVIVVNSPAVEIIILIN